MVSGMLLHDLIEEYFVTHNVAVADRVNIDAMVRHIIAGLAKAARKGDTHDDDIIASAINAIEAHWPEDEVLRVSAPPSGLFRAELGDCNAFNLKNRDKLADVLVRLAAKVIANAKANAA